MRWTACAAIALAVFGVLACRDPRLPPGTARAPARGAPPAFSCAGTRCTERRPRMPDDGDWTCADSAGATVCVGGERAAGVAPAPADPAWSCGPRRGTPADRLGARICVDPFPDFPDGKPTGWRCSTLYDPPLRRVCDRDPGAWTLGSACAPARPCAEASRCLAGRCAPPDGPPDCWLDTDCPSGRCRFGRCVEAHP